VLVLVILVSMAALVPGKKLKDKLKRDVLLSRPDDPAAEGFDPHQEYLREQEHQQEVFRKKLVKPKGLKVLSAYEECKHQCKQQRDAESVVQYVERLREELHQAEELLSQRGQDTVVEVGEH